MYEKLFRNAALAVVTAGMGVLAVSCSGGSAAQCGTKCGEVAAESFKSGSKCYLAEGDNAVFADSLKIYSKVDCSLVWPERIAGADVSALQDSIMYAGFGFKAASVEGAIDSALVRPEGSDMFRMTAIDSIPSGPSMIYTSAICADIAALTPKYAVYDVTKTSYAGGAHGSTSKRYLTFSIAASKVLDKANAFIAGSDSTLVEAITDNLCAQYRAASVKQLAEMGFDTESIAVPANFYPDGYNMVFVFNEYEVAPYSAGIVKVAVPYYPIRESLTPVALSLFE